jgi:hypothetical protein
MSGTHKAPSIEVHDSGQNIFAGLGVADADGHHIKARIAVELYRLSTERAFTQAATGRLLGSQKCSVCLKANSVSIPSSG